MKVVHLQRRRPAGYHSMEGQFARVRDQLAGRVTITAYVLPCQSRGVINRVRNLWFAWRHQGNVTHMTGDDTYVCLVLSRRRTVVTIHDCEILTRLQGVRRFIVKWLWFVLPARRAAAVTVVSEETGRQVRAETGVHASRVSVIPVAISELFQPAPRPFHTDCPTILQVGTKQNKNLERLAVALEGINCQLQIIGQLSDQQQQVLQQHRISYRSHTGLSDAQVVQLYQQADIMAFVSTYEGFGMPILEAQAVERVCVTSNCSSMPEVAGQGACLVDPFDVSSIRSGILRVIQDADYRDQLIQQGRLNRQRFEVQSIAEQYLHVYRQVAQVKGQSDV